MRLALNMATVGVACDMDKQDTIDMLTVFLNNVPTMPSSNRGRQASRWGSRPSVRLSGLINQMSSCSTLVFPTITLAPLQRICDVHDPRQIPVALTTTNAQALTDIVGPTATLEIVGKPYDLD